MHLSRCSTYLRKTASLCLAMIFAVGIVSSPSAEAAPLFHNARFVYQANDKPLGDVLRDFASTENIPIVVDAGVTGTVSAKFDTAPQEFLTAISKAYGIIWYYDGTTIFFYPSSAMESKVFRMRGYTRTQVGQMLRSLGLGDPRFPLRFDDKTQTLLAYGPPRHIQLVTTVLQELERDNHDRLGTSIAVIKLRYAVAADRTFGNATIPGLARTLNRLFGNKDDSEDSDAPSHDSFSKEIAGRMKSLQYNYGMQVSPEPAATEHNRARDAHGGHEATALQSSVPVENFDADRPFFQAEKSTNSIIVRGLPDRMPEYRRLVKELDKAQNLVEIEATIIDISASDFNRLGVNWQYSENGTTRFSASTGNGSSGGSLGQTDSSYNVSTLIGGASHQFLNEIQALEGVGRARIVARPQVVGVVNHPAVMKHQRTASVRVAGNLDTSLYQIQTGTQLSVIPQIVAYNSHNEVRLSLSIQDGGFENQTVDDIPIVRQTEINTDATMREGESLLIGGISVDQTSDDYSGLPWIARVPLLGALFRTKRGSSSHEVRLFMLTPKIIKVGENRQPQVATTHPNDGSLRVICRAQDLMVSPRCLVQGY